MSALLQAMIAVFVGVDGNRVELYADEGLCVEGAKGALYVYADTSKPKVPGCWSEGNGAVGLAWFSGEFGRLPTAAFKKVEPL